MEANLYQELAARTINKDLSPIEQELHALHGMSSEVGELHGIHQKVYQGHPDEDPAHHKKELGDLLWFIAEYCTVNGWTMSEIMELNIEKLSARYPYGFDAERSLHREAVDV